MNRPAISLAAAFVACVWLANWMTNRWGFVHLGPFAFTAGTYAAGLSFGLRDALQEASGRSKVIGAILVGAALSALVSPSLALASGVAFLLSESLDLAIYTPLRERHWHAAVVASNLAGGLADTLLFLWLAFGAAAVSGPAVTGQMAGKALMVLPGLVVVRCVRGK